MSQHEKARIELWPHQRAAVDAARQALADGHTAGLWVMPTGSGKTRAFCTLARELDLTTLVIVHRDELLRQTADTLREVWPEVAVATLKEGDPPRCDVLVATVQRLSRRLGQFPEDRFALVVVDEAHHAPAESWGRTIGHFRPELLLGCTATPVRLDGQDLLPLFGDNLLYEYGLEEAIDDGHLVPLRQRAILTSVSIDGVRRSRGDLSRTALAPVVVTPARTQAVVDGYLAHGKDRPALFFCVNTAHVEQVWAALRDNDVTARSVTGETPGPERKAALAAFRRGEVRALVSCEVLTEGYDEPGLSCVVMARPTTSLALYQQCVGRGLRVTPGGGKADCLVLDVVDRGRKHEVVYAARMFGGRTRDCGGGGVREVVARERESWLLEPLSPTAAQLARWDCGEETEWPEHPTLHDHVPTGWREGPASEKQLALLRRLGFETNRPLTGGEAHHLIEQCILLDRRYPTAPTPGQVWRLTQAGSWRAGMTKREAQREIGRLAAARR